MRQTISIIRPFTWMQLLDRLWSFWYPSLMTQTKSDFLLKKVYWLTWAVPVEQNHYVISVKTFWMRPSLIDFVRAGILLWNIETDKRCIVVGLYQFLSIYYWLVRIVNSSDDALLVRAKRQKPQEKHGPVDRTRIQSLLIKMIWIIPMYDWNFSKFSYTFS